MLHVLVLRPEPDATRTAAALVRAGHEPVVTPLFTIAASGHPCPEGPYDAVVVTSANAVAPLVAQGPANVLQLPVFTVGHRSAAVARAAGFAQVESAGGARDDLARLLVTRLRSGSRLLLAVGRDRKDDLAPRLVQAGIVPVLWTAYCAVALSTLPRKAAATLTVGCIDAILHYSRRGAETFISLAGAAGLWDTAARLTHVVLSTDIAEPLLAHGALDIVITARPDEGAVLDSLSGICARNCTASGDSLAHQSEQLPVLQAGPAHGDSMSAGGSDRNDDPAGQSSTPSGRSGKARRQPGLIDGDVVRPTAPEPAAPAEVAAVETPSGPQAAPESTGTVLPAAPSPETSVQPVPPASRTGIVSIVSAAVLGGLIGGGATLILPRLVPALNDSSGRIASLDHQMARLLETSAPRQALEAVDTKASAASAAAERAQAASAATAKRLADLLAAAPSGTDPASIAPIAEQARRAEALAASATESLVSREKLLDETVRTAAALSARIATVEQATKTVSGPGSAATHATRLLLANRIYQALDAGRPFAPDVRALAVAGPGGPDPARLAPLLAVAETGVATREALRGEFRRLRPSLEQDSAAQPASLGDRVLKAMEGMVSVRPLGEQSGSSPLALTARIDRALGSGDMDAAVTAWRLLPEPARRATDGFGARLAARALALATIRTIEDETVAALGASR